MKFIEDPHPLDGMRQQPSFQKNKSISNIRGAVLFSESNKPFANRNVRRTVPRNAICGREKNSAAC